jgi:ParB family chromosome partitioning protein
LNELQRPLDVIETEINFYKTQTATGIIEIGKRLIEAKEQLQHGEWGKWLEERVQFSYRSAARFMQVAKELSNMPALAGFEQSKVFALLDVPKEEREEFIQSNPVNEMTTRELQRAIKEKKEAERQARELEQENQKLKNKPPQIIEKEVVKEVIPRDYTSLKHRVKDHELQIERLESEKEILKRKVKLNAKNAKEYESLKEQIGQLTQKKDELGRQIKAVTELSGLVVRVENLLKTELAPIKYSRAIHEARNDEIVLRNLRDILNRVSDWCQEMYGYIPKEDYIEAEVIESEYGVIEV